MTYNPDREDPHQVQQLQAMLVDVFRHPPYTYASVSPSPGLRQLVPRVISGHRVVPPIWMVTEGIESLLDPSVLDALVACLRS
jgi:hypothetical protein